jgi:zinc D-Ala-D-Ala carboxypeptidase
MTWEYFTYEEFDCKTAPGSAKKHMNVHFINRLEYAREDAGIPFVITSGYRTREYNDKLRAQGYETSRKSAHIKGLAADIATKNSEERYIILCALINEGFTRIGIGQDFIHVDCDESKADGVVWLYYGF